jgi:hypothetical protein
VVRREWCTAGIEIDFHVPADAGEGHGCHDVVDAPGPVALKCVSEVVQIGVLDTVGVKRAEHVGEAPGGSPFEGVACVDVEIDVVDAVVGMVDVDGFRGDVQVAKPDGGFGGIEALFEIGTKIFKPLELERAGYFSAAMYLMWTPNASSGCSPSNGLTCAISVPLGSVTWGYSGDAINSLDPKQGQAGWLLQCGSGPANPFQASSAFPTWTTFNNTL